MRPTNILRTIATIALISAPFALQAQARRAAAAPAPMNSHAGYSVSLGLGGGSSALTCTGCPTSDRENGASGYLSVSKGMTPSIVAGIELNGWNKTENNVSGRLGMLSAVAQWYPSMTNGFFAKAGLGLARTTIDDKTTATANKAEATGFGYQVGMGYDWTLARRWSVTPFVNYLGAPNAQAKLNGTDVTGQKMGSNYVQYGLGLNWH